jgi:hypothetical protein
MYEDDEIRRLKRICWLALAILAAFPIAALLFYLSGARASLP